MCDKYEPIGNLNDLHSFVYIEGSLPVYTTRLIDYSAIQQLQSNQTKLDDITRNEYRLLEANSFRALLSWHNFTHYTHPTRAIPLQMHHSMDQLDMLDPTGSMTTLAPISESPLTPTHQHLHGSYHSMNHMMSHHHPGTLSGHTAGKCTSPAGQYTDVYIPSHSIGHHGHSAVHHPVITAAVAAAGLHPDTDTDPRELEAFAERFKQRRIKLGKSHRSATLTPLYIVISLS